MSLEENKAIIRKMIEAINKQKLALLDELIISDCVYHMNVQPIRGLTALKQVIAEEIKGFPDLHVAIEDIMAEGNKVCVRLKETLTHTSEFRGLAPTGKKVTDTAVAIFRIGKGKVVEGWGVYDQMDFFKQLGVIEYKGFPDEKGT
jgi:predicted ester cyclase